MSKVNLSLAQRLGTERKDWPSALMLKKEEILLKLKLLIAVLLRSGVSNRRHICLLQNIMELDNPQTLL